MKMVKQIQFLIKQTNKKNTLYVQTWGLNLISKNCSYSFESLLGTLGKENFVLFQLWGAKKSTVNLGGAGLRPTAPRCSKNLMGRRPIAPRGQIRPWLHICKGIANHNRIKYNEWNEGARANETVNFDHICENEWKIKVFWP